MEYIALVLILLGAVYLLIRSARGKAACNGRFSSCEMCSRVARPPAERLYQISLPEKNKNTSAEM